MKTSIHPKWFPQAKVICACGNTFEVGATQPDIRVEICYSCHPFYTGQVKFVDRAGRVDSFNEKLKGAAKKLVSKSEKRQLKREKRLQEEMNRPDSLEALRSSV